MARRGRVQIQGDLQLAVMRVMWRLDEASVTEVSRALPKPHRGAYTTIQTVLNRLADRGLLTRARRGRAIRYSPKVKETDYLARSLQDTLSEASPGARQAALTRLIGELDSAELPEVEALAEQIERARRADR